MSTLKVAVSGPALVSQPSALVILMMAPIEIDLLARQIDDGHLTIELPPGKQPFIKKFVFTIAHTHDGSIESGRAGQCNKQTRYIVAIACTSRENISRILVQL